MRNTERGAVHPLWLAVGVLTCVVVGTSVNRCLTCGAGPDRGTQASAALPPLESEAINPIAAAPVPDADAEAEADESPITSTVRISSSTPAVVETEEETGVDPLAGSLEPFDTTPKPLPKLPDAPKPEGLADHKDITFDFVADYVYEFPEPGQPARDQIPQKIKDLAGKKVAIKGFMIPIRTEGEQVVEFILVRNQMACCYGAVPRMNEWVHVKMAEKCYAPYAIDIPITVFGTLEVGEVYEDGIVMSLYRMQSTHVVEPPILR